MKNLILATLILVFAPMTWAQRAVVTKSNVNVTSQFESKVKAQLKNLKSVKSLQGGVVNGGGGDHKGQEFTTIGRIVRDQLADQKFALKINPEEFQRALQIVEVEFTDDQLTLNGVEKDAINYPTLNRIRVSKSAWASMSLNSKKALVLHEYLGIMGINDTTYEISYKLLSLKVEKFECGIRISGYRDTESTRISYKLDDISDGGQKQNADLLKLKFDKLMFGTDVLTVVWDFAKAAPDDTAVESRPTRIYIRAPNVPGAMIFNAVFKRNTGKNSVDAETVSMALIYNEKNVLGDDLQKGNASFDGPLMGPMQLGVYIRESRVSGIANCRVR